MERQRERESGIFALARENHCPKGQLLNPGFPNAIPYAGLWREIRKGRGKYS
jgi:hypothetical protein